MERGQKFKVYLKNNSERFLPTSVKMLFLRKLFITPNLVDYLLIRIF